MELDICMFYEPKNKRSDKLCRYFTGDRTKKWHIERCRHYCSIYEAKQLMEEGQVLVRKHGALKQK